MWLRSTQAEGQFIGTRDQKGGHGRLLSRYEVEYIHITCTIVIGVGLIYMFRQ